MNAHGRRRQPGLIVAAAGNETTNNNGTIAFIPSDLSSVMSVSSTGTNDFVGDPSINPETGEWSGEFTAAPGSDVLALYSNFGAAVDVAAPGGDCGPAMDCWSWTSAPHQILSSCAFPSVAFDEETQSWWPTGGLDQVWCFAIGTSMAAPHVAGVAAAVRAVHPTFTAGETRSWLKSTASPMGGRQGFGAGIVNADLATP